MVAIEHEFRFPVPPAQVFRALVDEDALQAWWTPHAKTTGQIGSTATVRFEGDEGFARFTVWDLDEPRHVQWRVTDSNMVGTTEWDETIIDWRIEPDGADASRVRFRHYGFDHESPCVATCRDGWAFFGGRSLGQYLETGVGLPHSPQAA